MCKFLTPFAYANDNANKCTNHKLIYLLTATFKDMHVENGKNCKRWYYSAAHWHTDSVLLN